MFIRNDYYRFGNTRPTAEGAACDYRSEYSRDYARVLHCPSFRRLQNKTQLFPGQESDFFRNRLTHSLEVSQIAKSIANKMSVEHPELGISPDVCEIAGLVHDIGHPPFGHNGESALDDCMKSYGGFEGNAQTIRILTRLEKKERPESILDVNGNDTRTGLNLTARVIASALKYDQAIPRMREFDDKLVKGYYESERAIIDKVKDCLVENASTKSTPFKTIECSIMDIADDIAYSTYDVEDAFKADFLTPLSMIAANHSIFEQITEKLRKDYIDISPGDCRDYLIKVFEEIWDGPINLQKSTSKGRYFNENTLNNFLSIYENSEKMAKDGYYRTAFTSKLVNTFINGVHVEINKENPLLSRVEMDQTTKTRVNILKHFSYVSLINSSRLKVAENRGHDLIVNMFNKLYSRGGYALLPEDTKTLYLLSEDALWRARTICDFIAGMTDRYAMEFYGRLFSENPQTIFKPL